MRRFLEKLVRSRAAKLAAAAAGSWHFWAASAFAATVAGAVIVVVFATSDSDPGHPYLKLDNDRVLLMNADINAACPIEREGYNDTKGRVTTNFWVHSTEAVPGTSYFPNIYKGYNHTYWKDDDRRLWSLISCRFGNTWKNSTGTFSATQNYLPYEATARRVNSSTSPIGTNPHFSGHVVMQCVKGAQVVSSCYPDGIGTGYFDAVNAFTG